MRIGVLAARVGVTMGLLGATLAAPFGLTHGIAASAHHHKTSGQLTYCFGKVTRVDDGDTVYVHLTSSCPGGTKGHTMVIRNAGMQAMEIAHGASKAECWSKEGKRVFTRLMPHGRRVRLSSYGVSINAQRTAQGQTRLIKYVDARVGGRWVDVQAAEISSGHALYKQEPVETARLAEYMRDQQEAMYNGVGMWGHSNHCSRKYNQHAQFNTWIVWKTNGADTPATAHEESFNVKNIGTTSVNLSHWAVRDASHYFGGGTKSDVSAQRPYMVLPKGTVLAPGHTLVIHPSHGKSQPSKDIFYDNGRDIGPGQGAANYFANSPMGHGGLGAHPTSGFPGGGGLYLVDPARDFRAWASYPCVYKCATPAPLTLFAESGADTHGREYVQVHNPTQDSVGLTGDVLDMDGRVMNLSGDLPAGATMMIHCKGAGKNSKLNKFWDNVTNQLPNSGGTIWLRTARDVTIDKYSWGNSGDYNYFR